MRTILELWLIVEENFDNYFEKGLCEALHNMFISDLITGNEKLFLCDVIRNYAHARFNFSYPELYSNYCWEIGHKKPRKMFIQKQILKALKK